MATYFFFVQVTAEGNNENGVDDNINNNNSSRTDLSLRVSESSWLFILEDYHPNHGLVFGADEEIGQQQPSVPSSWMQKSNFSIAVGWWTSSLRNSRSSSAGNQAGGSSASG